METFLGKNNKFCFVLKRIKCLRKYFLQSQENLSLKKVNKTSSCNNESLDLKFVHTNGKN